MRVSSRGIREEFTEEFESGLEWALNGLRFQGGTLPWKADIPESCSCPKASGMPLEVSSGMFEQRLSASLAEM